MHGMEPIQLTNLVLVEDNEVVAQVLQQALVGLPDLRLAARVGTLADGCKLLNGPPADVMLTDLGLPDGSGVDLIRATRRAWPACQIMVLSVFGDEANVIRSLEAGAQGYLLKDMPAEDLVKEIRALRDGGSPISPRIARHVLNRLISTAAGSFDEAAASAVTIKDASLSARETEVLNHIARGFTYDEIAKKMNVSRHTVLTFVRRIYIKLEAHSKIEAINIARSRGLVDG